MLQPYVKATASLLLCISSISLLALPLLASRPLGFIRTPLDQQHKEDYGFTTRDHGSHHPSEASASSVAPNVPATLSWKHIFHPKFDVGKLRNMLTTPPGPNPGGNSSPTTVAGGLMAVLHKPTNHIKIEDVSEQLGQQTLNDGATLGAHHQLLDATPSSSHESYSITYDIASGAETEIKSSRIFSMLPRKKVPSSSPSNKHN